MKHASTNQQPSSQPICVSYFPTATSTIPSRRMLCSWRRSWKRHSRYVLPKCQHLPHHKHPQRPVERRRLRQEQNKTARPRQWLSRVRWENDAIVHNRRTPIKPRRRPMSPSTISHPTRQQIVKLQQQLRLPPWPRLNSTNQIVLPQPQSPINASRH